MGYSLDYFVANLQCPVCGNVSEADDSTNVWTYIRDEPELAYLGVGHPLTVRPEAMEDRGYLTVQPVHPGQKIRILQTWECPFCGKSFNWAEIVICEGVIESISAVALNREVLERVNFISTESVDVAARLTNSSIADLNIAEVVPILLEQL
jgi:rubredoxin